MSERQKNTLNTSEPGAPALQINQARADEFLKSLDERPKDRLAFIYQAIIVSLLAHIFILFVTQMLTEDHRATEDEVIYEELAMDMLSEEPLPSETEPSEQQPKSGDLRNLVANENSEQSSEAKNYRGLSSSQMKEQVSNDLKAMEAEEFAKLNEGSNDYTVATKSEGGKKENSAKQKSDMDWYREQQNNKSYSGPVTASFNMAGRDPMENPIPTYRCKTNGVVVVLVSIDESGKVIEARINEAKSVANDCLREESVDYAKKWKFDYSSSKRKQDGTITFTFSRQ